MAGGPILPSSIYLGGASGNLAAGYYSPNTNTNTAGFIEGIQVIASLNAAADAPAVLQFNLPEVLPTGTFKLRCLAMANATTGTAKLNIQDGRTPVGSSIGVATLNQEGAAPTISQTWATADILVENKITLTTVPQVNDIITVLATFTASGWNLAQLSVWQFSLVWE
jgi:hypothetical protein